MKDIKTLIESSIEQLNSTQPNFENQPASTPLVQPDSENVLSGKAKFLADKADFHKQAANYFAMVGLTDQSNFQNEMAEKELANSQAEANNSGGVEA